MLSPEDSTSIVAGGGVAREAASIVVSRSKDPVAASVASRSATRVTFALSSLGRRGPYSTWPSGRRGVRASRAGCLVPGLTTKATPFALESPTEVSNRRPADDSDGAGSLAVAVAAITTASVVPAWETPTMQPARLSTVARAAISRRAARVGVGADEEGPGGPVPGTGS